MSEEKKVVIEIDNTEVGYYSQPIFRKVFCVAKSRVLQRQNAIYCVLCASRSVLLGTE